MNVEPDERQPLLQQNASLDDVEQSYDAQTQDQVEKIEFQSGDAEDPRNWSRSSKTIQVAQIFLLAFICPMASSMLGPAVDDITRDFHSSKQIVLLAQTGFVCMLGIGPLFFAPMSETFGRRLIFLVGLAAFTLLQIPTALAPNVATLIVFRTLGGLFGSVGVANGGGSISDLYEPRGRAQVLGFYLVAPLLGPTIGPLLGGLIVGSIHWRWIFAILAVLAATTTIICFFFLRETRAITILQARKHQLEKQNPDKIYLLDGEPSTGKNSAILSKIATNSTRALRILTTQPIVLIMSIYQALIFSSMYSLYAEYSDIFTAPPYHFSKTDLGLAYLGPAIGFITTSFFIILFIDRLYDYLTSRHSSRDSSGSAKGQPEYRLPMANVGAVLLPISLFWFGWTVEYEEPWPIPLAATLFFGASQVSIFNTVQTYYIDAYEGRAASALAAGAFLRSIVGGIVPLFVGGLFENLGYGWGMSVFGFLSVVLMPAPMVFYIYGRDLRERWPFRG